MQNDLPVCHAHTLPNGLRILVAHVDGPCTAVRLTIDAGAADEREDEHGLAHLLEHMLFKGTSRRGLAESVRDIEATGGDLNAWTSHDQTTLYATVDPDEWPTAIDVIADMLLSPALHDDELQREINVVCEEIRAADDDPESVLSDHVEAALWGDHPYARRILGTEASVRSHTRDRLLHLLRREYGPDRSLLTVVGPVDPDEVVRTAALHLEGWTPVGARAPWPGVPAPRSQLARIKGDWDTSSVELSWALPPVGHPDLPALQVLAAVLGQGNSAILARVIQIDKALAYQIYADCSESVGGSLFSVGFIPTEEHARLAIECTLNLIDDLQVAPRGPSVDRARRLLLCDALFDVETIDQIASLIAHHGSLHGTPDARATWKRAIAATTAADVRDVAARWLRRDRVVIGVIDRQVTDRALQKVLQPPKRAARNTAPGGPVTVQHPNGTTVIVQPDSSPLLHVRVMVPGGALRQDARRAGLGDLWTRSLTAGAGRFDPIAITQSQDFLGADLNGEVSQHTMSISASAPADAADELFEILEALVLDPHFDADDIDRVRAEQLDDLISQQDRPSEVAQTLLRSARWAGHPWACSPLGTADSVRRLTHDDVRAWHDQHFKDRRGVLSIVGGLHPDAALKATAWWADLKTTASPKVVLPPPNPAWGSTTVARAGSEQAHVVLFGPGPAMTHPDATVLELVAAMLDGQAGRLFMELRERQGLAYDVWASAYATAYGGTLQLGLATDVRHVEAASTGLRQILEGLSSTPPSVSELDRARRQLLTRLAAGEQRGSLRAWNLARRHLLGFPVPPSEAREHLMAVTPDAVHRVVTDLLGTGTAEVRVMPRP